MLRITLSRLGSPEHVIDLRDRTLRIGRGAGNEVLLQDPDKTVSRTHGEVRREAAGWVFIDNDSQNGSWVDGRSVDRVVLRDGVVVAFGDYELICQEVAVADASAPGGPVGAHGAAVLGSDDPTRLGPDATAALPPPPVRRTDIHDLPTIVAPAFMPGGDTTPSQPPPVRRTDIHDQPTVFAPAYQPDGAADDDDAKTIVVPSDFAAPIVSSVAAADAVPDEMAELPTIVVPGFGSVPPPAPSQSAPDADDDAATVVVPAFGQAPPPAPAAPPPPVAVEPSWFGGGAGSAPPVAGDRPTVLAAPAPVFPSAVDHDADSTQVVPGDLSELFRTPVPPAATRPLTSPGAVAPPPPPVSPVEAEEIATVLIPGRPATGQLAAPPRQSGEVPVPPAAAGPAPSSGSWTAFPVPAVPAQAPWELPPVDPIPVGARAPTPAPFPAPAFEPPQVAPPAAAPPPAPVTAVAPPPVAPVVVPPAPVMAPPPPAPPVAAAPAPPPPVVAPRPAAAPSFRPAVLLWGLAWLALFGLIGAGIWIWTSSDGATGGSPPAESSSATPLATEPPPPSPEPAPPVATDNVAATTPPATEPAAPPPAEASTAPSPPPEPAPPPPAEPSSPTPAAAEVWADRPPPTAQATGVPRKPGERTADYRKRVADIERQYMAGRDALAAGRAVEARDVLRAVAAAAPTYKDVDGLLRDAEAAVRREGAAALASAEKLEQAREFDKAMAALRRAEQFGAPADQVGAVSARVQQQMRAAGEKAFADARQFDGLGRNADAARLYEIAVRYLPEGDPRRAQARQRLDVLTARRP